MPAEKIGDLFFDIRAGVSSLQKDFGVAKKQIDTFTNGIDKTFKTLGVAIGGYLSFRGLKLFSDQISDLASRGEDLGSVEEGFRKLGGSVESLESAKQATLGMITNVNLLKIANEGLIKNIPGFNQGFGQMAEFAARFADSTKQQTQPVLEKLVDAMGKGAPKAFIEFGIRIDGAKTKLEAQKMAMEQMIAKTSTMSAVTDSAANAQTAASNALENLRDKTGKAVNENENLQKAFRDLESEINKVDVGELAANLSEIKAIFIGLAADAIPWATRQLNNFATGLELLKGESNRALQADIMSQIEKRQKALNASILGMSVSPQLRNQIEVEIESRKKALKDLQDEIDKDAIRSAEEVNRLKIKDEEERNRLQTEADRRRAEEEAARAAREGKAEAERNAKIVLAKQKEEEKAAIETANLLQKKQEEAYKASIDTWRGLFENAITGATFDLESALNQVAVGFAAQMAQAIFGNIGGGGIGSPQDIGGALANSIIGQITGSSGGAGGIPGMAGSAAMGSILSGTELGGFAGALGGNIGPLASGAEYSGAMAAGPYAAAMPYAAAAIIAGSLIMKYHKEIESFFGAGTQNKETNARKDFAGALEEIFKKNGGLSFFDEKGTAQILNNILARPYNDFNQSNWGEQFKQTAGANAGAFTGAGNALGAVFGTGDLPMEQVGAMLAESVGGSLEGLKAILQGTGKSLEDYTNALIQLGKDGTQTWVEIEGSIVAVEEAMKPGLAAVGAFNDAFGNLLQTGARGQVALNQVRNTAIEAQEAQLTSFQQWQEQMTASGRFSQSAIDAFFQALAQRGVTSFDQVINGSDRLLGQIIADMQAMGVQFEDGFKPLQEALNSINTMPDVTEKQIKFNVTTTLDEASQNLVAPNIQALNGLVAANGGHIQRFASGGIVNSATMFRHSKGFGLMGEAGPEAIMPLTRVNGKLGVMSDGGAASGVNIYVNAQGAGAGVEHQILSALLNMKDDIVNEAVATTLDYQHRGFR